MATIKNEFLHPRFPSGTSIGLLVRGWNGIRSVAFQIRLMGNVMSEDQGMRIGELASQSGVSVRSLRYYEEQGLLHPRRTSGGQRVYTAEYLTLVVQIQELFQAGFCSSVIYELLPALGGPVRDTDRLQAAFEAATARLESEKESIESELSALSRLRARLGLAPDTRVSLHGGHHDSSPAAPPAPFDHRDRRLR